MSPFKQVLKSIYLAITLAATASFSLGKAKAGKVTKVTLIPNAAFTGADTNTRKFELINKGQAGGGSTVIASLTLTAGKNLVAFDEKELTLSVVENATKVLKDDVLVLVSSAVGTGIADTGGGVCYVEISKD